MEAAWILRIPVKISMEICLCKFQNSESNTVISILLFNLVSIFNCLKIQSIIQKCISYRISGVLGSSLYMYYYTLQLFMIYNIYC